MNSKFFLSLGIAIVMAFGTLSAFYSGGHYAFKKTAVVKEQIVQAQPQEG